MYLYNRRVYFLSVLFLVLVIGTTTLTITKKLTAIGDAILARDQYLDQISDRQIKEKKDKFLEKLKTASSSAANK